MKFSDLTSPIECFHHFLHCTFSMLKMYIDCSLGVNLTVNVLLILLCLSDWDVSRKVFIGGLRGDGGTKE